MSEPRNSAGDRFLALLRPLQRGLETYARRLLWDPSEVADALQNAVLRAYAAFDRYREDASFRSWMFRILTREVFALNRKHARIARHEFQLDPVELAELPMECADPPDRGIPANWGVLEDQLEPALTRALRVLTDNERAVLLLRAIAELRYREISETLGIPMGSVMGDLFRARQKMRAVLCRNQQALPAKPQRRI